MELECKSPLLRRDSIRVYKLYEDSEVITYGKADEAIFDDVIIV